MDEEPVAGTTRVEGKLSEFGCSAMDSPDGRNKKPITLHLTSLCFLLALCERLLLGDERDEFFEARIRTVLVEQCYECGQLSVIEG